MENHLYECLYDITRSAVPEAETFLELKRYIAKIVLLHAMRREKIILDMSDKDMMEDEEPTLYHLIKTKRLRDTRAILRVQDSIRNIIKSPQDIPNVFLQHLLQKFRTVDIDTNSFQRTQGFRTTAVPLGG
jgi:hypothetical protein